MSKRLTLIFIFILIIVAFLRLYRITDIPPGVNQDEASIGYTAYSLLQTGRDEYGRLLPISFQSFGDWKLPLYIYATVPFVSIFGLSELAVRLPSALFGIASVGLTFILVQLLFKKRLLSFLSMGLMAIAPWSIHLSRVESESNAAVFLTILGMIFLLKSLGKKNWYIILSSIFFALTYFTYAGNHIFTTLLLLGTLVIYFRSLILNKTTLTAFVVFILLSGFIFYKTVLGADATKLSGISIFGDPSVVHAQIELPRLEHKDPNSFFARLTHNRVTYALERFGQNYINAFSGQFLFVKGGTNNAHNVQGFGNMYLVEALFLFLGLIYLIALHKGKEKYLVLWWFFISPIAASITKDAPHTNRMFAIFPILPLITSFGIYYLFREILRKKLFKKIVIVFVVGLFLLNVAVYLDKYYVHFPRNESQNWGLGYKELNKLISQSQFANKNIIMTRPSYSPYIYLLFYSKHDPSLYQKQAVRYPPTEDEFVHVKSFGRFTFRKIDWTKDLNFKNTLLIDWSSDIPMSLRLNYNPRYDVILPDNKFMFTVLETK